MWRASTAPSHPACCRVQVFHAWISWKTSRGAFESLPSSMLMAIFCASDKSSQSNRMPRGCSMKCGQGPQVGVSPGIILATPNHESQGEHVVWRPSFGLQPTRPAALLPPSCVIIASRAARLNPGPLERMNSPDPSPRRLFAADVYEAVALAEEDLPTLQAFFVGNPEYFLAVTGAPPRPDEAKQELEFRPPPGMPYDKWYVVGFFDSCGQMMAMASVLTDLLAPRVCHLSLFIVATALHVTGTAGLLVESLDECAKDEAACWLRLDAVVGTLQAQR